MENEVTKKISQNYKETKIFSDHTANLIQKWQDEREDNVWK